MRVTVLGIVICVSFVDANARLPIVVTEEGMVKLSRLEPSNADAPITRHLLPSAKVTRLSEVIFWNNP